MKNRNDVLKALKIVSEYCDAAACRDCVIKGIINCGGEVDFSALEPYMWEIDEFKLEERYD